MDQYGRVHGGCVRPDRDDAGPVPADRASRVSHRHHELFTFTVTNIAVLYAVLLAFIAVATWENFSHSTELAEAEANLVGNLYRDTDGFGAQPAAAALRTSLRDYVQIVIDKEWPEQQQGWEPDQGWPALESFQRELLGVEPQDSRKTAAMQEMLYTLNELYAERRSRVDASLGHIPPVVWYVILMVGAMTVGFTYLLGVESVCAHLIASGGLALALVLVVALIVQLDYPFRGTISVGPDAYEKVMANMHRLHPEVLGAQETDRLRHAASLPVRDLGNYH